MKIAYCSDLHIEFGQLEIKNTENADILVLAGDICVAKDIFPYDDSYENFRSVRIHDFFINCSKEFNHIIYIMGNHEHYHGDFKFSLSTLKDNLSYIKNLHILEKDIFELNDILFVCGTMWTDFNGGDIETLESIKWNMNDFRIVNNSLSKHPVNTMDGEVWITEKLTPQFAWGEHLKFVDYLHKQIKDKEKVVVVTHHGPSYKSIHPHYANDTLMNGGYVSDLEDVMLENPQIKYWIHGHVHNKFDYTVGETRVLTNPRGYIGHEEIADNFTLHHIEI